MPETILYDKPPGGFKKRRLQGACEMCKKRKIRCDSAKMPGNVCSNCKAFNSECIHGVLNKKKRTTFVNTTPTGPTTTSTESSGSPSILGSNDRFAFARSQIFSILEPSYQVPTNDSTLLLHTLKEISAYARSLEKVVLDGGPSTSNHSSPVPSDSQHSSSSYPPVSLDPHKSTDPLPLFTPYSTDAPSPDPDVVEVQLADSVNNLELEASAETFFGRSSQLALMKTAFKIKEEYDSDIILTTGGTKSKEKTAAGMSIRAANFADDDSELCVSVSAEVASKTNRGGYDNPDTHIGGIKRAVFWDVYPWQLPPTAPSPPSLIFPPPTLLASLVEIFFSKRNRFMPLLHQPTFQRGLDAGLHKTDRGFGELVLSVCALGARYSSDKGVFDDRELRDNGGTEHSIGWKYLHQINPMQEVKPHNALYMVQMICNYILFLSSTSTPGLCWPLLGLAVRHAQLVGAHRRTFLGTKPSVLKEQWKRAYWVLVCIDSYSSAFLGRPKATDPSEYDIELPLDVDDEFWEHPDPEQAFKQPADRPSWVVCWTLSLKLLDILAFAQKSIYAVKKPPEMWGSSAVWGSSWDEKVILELDSALNKWVDTIPDYLRWDPHREDPLFFEQSASLYCTYYWVQIQIHRPFIRPGLKQPEHNQQQPQRQYSGMSYSSLAVCANAARSCMHVLDLHSRRKELTTNYLSNPSPSSTSPSLPSPQAFISENNSDSTPSPMLNFQAALFNSAIMILLNLWAGSRLGMMADPRREMDDVYRCMRILKTYERRYQNAGRISDIISSMIDLRSWSEDRSGRGGARKRDREDDGGGNNKQATKMTKTASDNYNSALDAVLPSQTSQYTQLTSLNPSSNLSRYPTPNSASSTQTHSPESHFPLAPLVLDKSLSNGAEFNQSAPISQTDQLFYNADSDSALFGLPLYTEDLGRLPLLLNGSNDFMTGIESGSVSGAAPESGFEYAGPNADSDTLTAESWASQGGCGLDFRYQNQFDFGPDSRIEQKLHQEGQQLYSNPEFGLQDPLASIFSATPGGDRWEDWGPYMTNVDDLLRSIVS